MAKSLRAGEDVVGYMLASSLSMDFVQFASPRPDFVIVVTTKSQQTDRAWGLRQGAVDYLVKPVDPKELVARVKVALGE